MEGATIYYRTDGNAPDRTKKPYIPAIPITVATSIKAIAVKAGMTDSAVITAVYTIQATPVLQIPSLVRGLGRRVLL
jgi:hypothetical protein